MSTRALSEQAATDGTLAADLASRKVQVLREINQRNLGYFEREVEKLDAWADDLKLGLEQEIKGIDVEIKEVRRTAAISPTLEEKLSHQPMVTAADLERQLPVFKPTANALLRNLQDLGVLIEITGQMRDRTFVFDRYLNLFIS